MEEKNSRVFIDSITNLDIDGVISVPKTDLHNHASLGMSRERFIETKFKYFKFSKVNSFEEMKKFINEKYGYLLKNKYVNLSLIEGTILAAIDDGVELLECSIDFGLLEKFSFDYDLVYSILVHFKELYKDRINIKYDLGISRRRYHKEWNDKIIEAINLNIFNALDLYGDEKYKPYEELKIIYQYAKSNGLKLKAHIGEFSPCEDILSIINQLDLDVIQHGISITSSPLVMKELRNRKIVFNVCCTSNYMLGSVNNIAKHPIRKMFDSGIIVTINSDDQLLFNSSVSREYIKLYVKKVFNAEELNEIRKNGFIYN